MNDSEITDFNRLQPTQTDPPMEFFQLGPLFCYVAEQLPALDVRIDDVVVDTTRIGDCK